MHLIDGIINLEEAHYGKQISSVPSENIKKMKINKENTILMLHLFTIKIHKRKFMKKRKWFVTII